MLDSGVRKHAETRGDLGACSPRKIWNLQSQRLFLIALESSFNRHTWDSQDIQGYSKHTSSLTTFNHMIDRVNDHYPTKWQKSGPVLAWPTGPAPPALEYADDLMSETVRRCREYIVEETDPQSIPPPLSSHYETSDKQEAIQHHKSRFNL